MDVRTLRLLEFAKIRDLVCQHASSPQGKELAARMRPVHDARVVQSRMAETSEARRVIESHGASPFGGLHDMREAVQRAGKQGVLTAAELLDIAETTACCRRLRRYLGRAEESAPLLREQARLLQEFPTIERAVDAAIAADGEVLSSASPELDHARRRVRALNDDIHRELLRLISTPHTADALQELIITQRNGRFCVPVRAEARNAIKGIVHDLSASGQTVFVEPLSVVELGNDLREAERREEEEIQRVLAELSALVGRATEAILSSMEAAARLDVIFARAGLAREMEAVEPGLNTDGIIDLRQARHPLLGAQAVPIDVVIGQDGCSALIITGPNTGGKTVSLKTVGLLTLMAQSGLHVPAAEGTRLAIFDQVFADIGDEQSIEQSLSTFSSHLTNIVRIVKEAGNRALVLLDEIGAGTDPAEGAALAKAILLELQSRGCRIMVTTHYGELKIFGQSTDGFMNASVEFDPETLRPTYRVLTGLPGSSNAFYISQRLGLPKPLIAQAKSLMGEAPRAMEEVLKQAEGVRRALDRERTATARARREAEETADRLKRDVRELEDKREAVLAKSRERAQEVLHKARLEANSLLDELRTAIRASREQTAAAPGAADVATLRQRTREVLEEVTEEVESLPPPPAPALRKEPKQALETVLPGQVVYVPRVGHRGTVLERGEAGGEVTVQVGIMRMQVPVNELEPAAAPPPAYEPPVTSATPQPRAVDPEIHLLGLRAEEAAERLEEYLYAAAESGLSKVRIVHGFGTGALRKVVQEMLRNHPAVRSFRLGQSGEGGGGVTIAELGK